MSQLQSRTPGSSGSSETSSLMMLTPSPVQTAGSTTAGGGAKNRIDSDHKLWVPITSLNTYLTCGICKGYLYEAATITECMHSFCKSCIVRHVQYNLHCPTCQVLIHPTDPFVNIRLDRLLQDIVYGLLPKVAEDEIAKEKKFYAENDIKQPNYLKPSTGPVSTHLQPKPASSKVVSKVPMVAFSLQCKCSSPLDKTLEKRFIKVTGDATINNVALFLRKKLVLTDDHVVSLFCSRGEGCVTLEASNTLFSVKEQYFKQEDLFELEYEVCARQWLD